MQFDLQVDKAASLWSTKQEFRCYELLGLGTIIGLKLLLYRQLCQQKLNILNNVLQDKNKQCLQIPTQQYLNAKF